MKRHARRIVGPTRLMACLDAALRRVNRFTSGTSLALIDIDGMARVNATYGHEAGNELILNAGLKVCSEVRKNDIVAYLGADEFAILISRKGSMRAVRQMRKLARRLRRSVVVVGSGIGLSPCASIGGASSRVGSSADALLGAAHEALVTAKRRGGGVVVWAGS
jgi:diguanylate cyclase (GGDEF)-like protein